VFEKFSCRRCGVVTVVVGSGKVSRCLRAAATRAHISAGYAVVLVYSSANRDETVFTDP